jgi:hypothetical protein
MGLSLDCPEDRFAVVHRSLEAVDAAGFVPAHMGRALAGHHRVQQGRVAQQARAEPA